MNLNPLRLFTRGKSNDMSTSALARSYQALGIWQGAIGQGFIPRQVNPWFYAALREALGPLDGGIDRLVTMDGIIGVEGGNDKITNAVQNDFLKNIPFNDLEAGLQAFFAAQGDMMLEHGCAVGEMVMDKRGKELIGLRIADSKGVVFHREGTQLATWYRPPRYRRTGRRDGTDAIETVIRNNGLGNGGLSETYLTEQGFIQMDPATMVYGGYNSHADNPYGVSILRSIEFVSQLLVRIQNSTGLTWDRFGDPVFHILYQTKNRTLKGSDFDKRRDALAKDFQTVMNTKRGGNSADFVQAVGADDNVIIKVIGEGNQVLAMDVPARHMLDQILAKFGLPSWMLGIEVRTSGSMGDQQSEMVIQASKTRFDRRRPGLERIVATWLRGRGFTWKPGDWQMVQTLPNLYDELKRAQAGFLQAQTQMMLRGGGNTPSPQGNLPGNDGGMGNVSGTRSARMPDIEVPLGDGMHVRVPTHARSSHRKAPGDSGGDNPDDAEPAHSEPWADTDPQLPKIETAAVEALQADWHALYQRVYQTLRLSDTGAATFTFDATTMLQALTEDQEWFIARAGAVDGPYLQQVFVAWTRGIINGAAEIDAEAAGDAAIEQALQQLRGAIGQRQLSQVRNTSIRVFADDIVAELQRGIYDGQNPATVARALEERFGMHDYDWLRLARSEIASANAKGKLQSYIRNGFLQYDFLTAPGACEICTGIAAAGPYMVGAGPMPMDDTHPLCRCSVHARASVTPAS